MKINKSTSSEIFDIFASKMVKRAGVLEEAAELAEKLFREKIPPMEIESKVEWFLHDAGAQEPGTAKKIIDEVVAKSSSEAGVGAVKPGIGEPPGVTKTVEFGTGKAVQTPFAPEFQFTDEIKETIQRSNAEGKVITQKQYKDLEEKLHAALNLSASKDVAFVEQTKELEETRAMALSLETQAAKDKEVFKEIKESVIQQKETAKNSGTLDPTSEQKFDDYISKISARETDAAAEEIIATQAKTKATETLKNVKEVNQIEEVYKGLSPQGQVAQKDVAKGIYKGIYQNEVDIVTYITKNYKVTHEEAEKIASTLWRSSWGARAMLVARDVAKGIHQGSVIKGAANLAILGLMGYGGYKAIVWAYKKWFSDDPTGAERVKDTLKQSIGVSVGQLQSLQFAPGSQGEIQTHDLISELNDNLKSIDYLNGDDQQIQYAHNHLAELQKHLDQYLTNKEQISKDLTSPIGFDQSISSLQNLQSQLGIVTDELVKRLPQSDQQRAGLAGSAGGPGPESPGSSALKETPKPVTVNIYGETIDITKQGPQYRSLAGTITEGLLKTPMGMAFVDPDDIWGGYYKKTGNKNIDYHQSLNYLIDQHVYDKQDLRRFMRHNMEGKGRHGDSRWREAIKYYEKNFSSVLARSRQAEKEHEEGLAKVDQMTSGQPAPETQISGQPLTSGQPPAVPGQPQAQEWQTPASNLTPGQYRRDDRRQERQEKRDDRKEERQDRREERKQRRANLSQNNNDFYNLPEYSINKKLGLMNKIASMADSYSNKYYQDAINGLAEEYSKSYYTGLKGMYGRQGESVADVGNLYHTQKETGADLIGQAHPKSIVVSDAMGRGGLVENGLEQQMHTKGVALSAPSGNYRSKHAWLLSNLVKLANQADLDGNTEASDLVDSTFHQIMKLMKLEDAG